jgi:sterol desaturase/sphingolipid hydroxylase (fatty acid hydroxylase superfamily)
VIDGWLVQFKAWMHGTFLGNVPILERGLFNILDFFAGLLTGVNPRFHWFQITTGLLLAVVVYLTGRQVRPVGGWRGFIRYCFPKEAYTHPSARVDYQLAIMNAGFGFLFNQVTWRVNTVVMTALFTSWLTRMFGPAPHSLEWTASLVVGITALIIVAEDFASYAFHYVEHKVPFLWAIHKVHHSAEVLTPITGLRTHPLEYALAGASRSVVVALVLAPVIYLFTGPPLPLEIFGIGATVVVTGALGQLLQHSHVWLSFGRTLEHVLISPALHQIHHSQARQHWDRNFGVNFALWDWIFGTLYIPAGPVKITYGVSGESRQPHPNVFAAWLRPFWDMVPMRRRLVEVTAESLRSIGVRRGAMHAPSPPDELPPPIRSASWSGDD